MLLKTITSVSFSYKSISSKIKIIAFNLFKNMQNIFGE